MRFSRLVPIVVVMAQTAVSPSHPWIPHLTFAARLILIRLELDITQDQAANACDLKPSTWATWENGSQPRDRYAVVEAIVAGLGVDRDWLLDGTGNLVVTRGKQLISTEGGVQCSSHQMVLFDGGELVDGTDDGGPSWMTARSSPSTPSVNANGGSAPTRFATTDKSAAASPNGWETAA